jgi:hypothetical protein
MTALGSLAALLSAGLLTAGGLLGSDSTDTTRAAVVIDAAAARDDRDLVDARLRAVDAEIRLPRTPREARTNVRYFAAQDYRVVVAGSQATAAAEATGVEAEKAPGLAGALAALRR